MDSLGLTGVDYPIADLLKGTKMITAGIDMGIEATKAVILSNSEIVSWHVIAGGDEGAARLGERALNEAANKAGINQTEIRNIVATGLMSTQMPFVNKQVSEIMCIARGVDLLLPSTRTVLDLGAGKSLAMKCNQGKPTKIAKSDKCAAGTGSTLDSVAKVLGVGVEELADLSLKSKEYVEVQSVCAVFMESEVISLLHMKSKLEDIAGGVVRGMAKRVYPLLVDVGLEKDVTIVGGVAHNRRLAIELEALCGYNLLVPPEPQIVSALGAALIAREEMNS